MNVSEELPYLDVPLHTIMKMTTDGNNCTLDLIRLPIDCVDTYRQRPKVKILSACWTELTNQPFYALRQFYSDLTRAQFCAIEGANFMFRIVVLWKFILNRYFYMFSVAGSKYFKVFMSKKCSNENISWHLHKKFPCFLLVLTTKIECSGSEIVGILLALALRNLKIQNIQSSGNCAYLSTLLLNIK